MKVKLCILFIIICCGLSSNPIILPILTKVKLLDDQGNWEISLNTLYQRNIQSTDSTYVDTLTFYCNAGSTEIYFTSDYPLRNPHVISSIDINTDLRIDPAGDSLYVSWDFFYCKYGQGAPLNSLNPGDMLAMMGIYYSENTEFWWCHADSSGITYSDLKVKLLDSNNRSIDNAVISYDGYLHGQHLNHVADGVYQRQNLPCKQLEMRVFINSTIYEQFNYMGTPGTSDSITVVLDNYTQDIHEDTVLDKDLYITNYPNPFNPETEIVFSLKKQYSTVDVEIFNTKGQLVRSIPVSSQKTGDNSVKWDGKDNSGSKTASGTYYCRIKADGNVLAVNKMMLLK